MISMIQMSYGTISDEDFRRIFVPIGSAAAEDPEKQIIVDPEGDGSAVSLEKLHFWEDLAASKEKLSVGPCRKKTMMITLWAIFGVYASAFMEIYIHETRFGGQQLEHEPLWDIYELFSTNDNDFDYLFVLTERSMVFFISCYLLLLFFCENRHVIARRFMFFLGLIYFYRAIFITSTILPPTRKLIGDCSESQTNGSIGSLALRTLFFVFTGGFKMNQGGNNVCGGYLFSGHASIIILCSRFVCCYSSSRIPTFAKYALRILEVTCIVCIVLAREHYTIDVITAWFLMTREMWIYNSLLKLQDEKINDSIAIRNVWWAKVFVWIEADLPRDDAYLPKANF